MNPKMEYGIFGYRNRPYHEPRTLETMQREMKKLNADIDALKNMDLDCVTMYNAIDELKEKKRILLSEMHSELDRMYG